MDIAVDGNKAAMCVKSSCNEDDQTFDFVVEGKTYSCVIDFQVIEVSASGTNYVFNCPRLTQVCPR